MKNNKDNIVELPEQPYVEMTKLLYRAFHHFNNELAEGKLKEPIITIASSGRKAAYGWHLKDGWKTAGADMTELNVCAEFLDREFDEVLETLIHEMAHLKNSQAGIKDCNAVQYHNKFFKVAAESLGLVVEKMHQKGFARTSLGERATASVRALGIKQEDVPPIHRKYKLRARKVGGTTFILADKDDKSRFTGLTNELGLKQTEVFKLLLDVYKEFHPDFFAKHPERMPEAIKNVEKATAMTAKVA